MGESHRVQRVERELQHLIAEFLLRGFKGSLSGLVSVSRVIVTKDLRSARVFVSVLGTNEDEKASLKSLEDHAGSVQHYIGRNLRMKFCPKLRFQLDTSADRLMNIERLLSEVSLSQEV